MYNRYRIFNLLPKYKAKQFRGTVIKNTAVLIHTKVLDKNVMLSTMLGFLLTIMSMLHFLFACFILFSFPWVYLAMQTLLPWRDRRYENERVNGVTIQKYL